MGLFSQASNEMNMIKFFSTMVVSIACMSTLLGQDASPWIQYNGSEVNHQRVLVRFEDPSMSQDKFLPSDLLAEAGLSIVYRMETVAGLVILENTAGKLKPRSGYKPNKDALAKELDERINLLRDSGLFTYVEPDFIWHPAAEATDPAYVDGRLWGLRNTGDPGVENADIDAEEAWETTVGSRDVVIGVIDTGVRYSHQELAPQMWVNEGEIPGNGIDDDENGWIDDVHGINAILNSGDPSGCRTITEPIAQASSARAWTTLTLWESTGRFRSWPSNFSVPLVVVSSDAINASIMPFKWGLTYSTTVGVEDLIRRLYLIP